MKGIEGKILKLRMAKGISKADMSRACGITPTTYSNIEDDLTESINIETGRKIAIALGISFNELFEIDGDSQKIESLTNIVNEQRQKIDELKEQIVFLKNEKEHIKAHLVMQMVSSYSYEIEAIDYELARSNSEERKEALSQILTNIEKVFNINKDYYIKTGYLSESDFKNHYNEMRGMYMFMPDDKPIKSSNKIIDLSNSPDITF